MPKNILIFGAGGAGRELAFGLSLDESPDKAWNVEGFIDDTPELQGMQVDGLPVLGGRDSLKGYSGDIAVTIVDHPFVRKVLIAKIKQQSRAKFPVVIAPKSIASPHVEWGEGCILLPLNFIQPGIRFGKFVWVNGGNRIGHETVIGDYTTLFSGILIGGGVSVGSGCVIGSGAIVLPGKKIGEGSMIGGGSLVSKDIPPHVVAAGVPAKVIREISMESAEGTSTSREPSS